MVDLGSAPRPGPAGRERVFTVSEVTAEVKKLLESFGSLWLSGEISNLRRPPSGHRYFTLKDAHAQINAVLFSGMAARIRETVENGIQVRVFGRLNVYPPNGSYQIVVQELKREGKGTLQEQFEQLRAKLDAEGLFAAARKKKLPLLPRGIALVTSPTGAVIRDMLKVFDRRFGAVNAVLVPVKVQGEGSAQEIAAALALLAARRAEIEALTGCPLDVVITGRGGGSLEDLWAFNEEIVARAIAASPIPVVSAVGHETDTTIADYVADRRASTPSVAAELVVPMRAELVETLARLGGRLDQALRRRYAVLRTHLDGLARRPCLRAPEEPIRLRQQRLDELALRLPRALVQRLGIARREVAALSCRPVFARPLEVVLDRREPLPEWGMRLARAGTQALSGLRQGLVRCADRLQALERTMLRPRRDRLDGLRALLEGLHPQRVLARGYTLTKRIPDGRVIGSVTEVKPGDRVRIVFSDGSARVSVEGVDPSPAE